jgi:hypothetical protein
VINHLLPPTEQQDSGRAGSLVGALVAVLIAGCGGGGGGTSTTNPTDVKFGVTALVVVVNPIVNDANLRSVPTPGQTRSDVRLVSDDGVSATTSATGIAVLSPLTAGMRTISVSGTNVGGSFTVNMTAGVLREIALATTGTSAQVMLDIDYKSDKVTEIAPTMSIADVNAALKVSDSVVFFKGGVYTGDIDFSGSRVTLFGEGVLGGMVELHGNVTVSGSDSRIRGTRITGNLTMPASGLGLSFSRIDGTTTAEGSDATLLVNAICGSETITGSGSFVVGNSGVAPSAACP